MLYENYLNAARRMNSRLSPSPMPYMFQKPLHTADVQETIWRDSNTTKIHEKGLREGLSRKEEMGRKGPKIITPRNETDGVITNVNGGK